MRIHPSSSSSSSLYFHLTGCLILHIGLVAERFVRGPASKWAHAKPSVLICIQFQIGSSLNAPPALAEDIDFPRKLKYLNVEEDRCWWLRALEATARKHTCGRKVDAGSQARASSRDGQLTLTTHKNSTFVSLVVGLIHFFSSPFFFL